MCVCVCVCVGGGGERGVCVYSHCVSHTTSCLVSFPGSLDAPGNETAYVYTNKSSEPTMEDVLGETQVYTVLALCPC